MPKPLRVLLIEDSDDDAELLLHELRRGGYEPEWRRVDTASALTAALAGSEWDVVTCDYVMPQFGALQALTRIRESGVDVPVIIVSGQVGEEVAVAAMKAGAHDYVSKHRMTRLVAAIERELLEARERRGRRRAEATLLESEQRYRELVESLHDVVFEVGADERITYVSPSVASLGDVTPAMLIGHSFREIVHPDDLPMVLDSLNRTMQGAYEPLVYRVVEPSGALRWVRTSSRPVFAADGRFLALRGVMTDVTEQIEAEQAYQTVFEHSLQGLAVIRGDRMVLANPALAAISGYPLEELLGMPLTQLTATIVHPDDVDRMQVVTDEFIADSAKPGGYEFRIVRRDGRVRQLISANCDMRYRGQPARLVAYIDVTDRWQAEAAYRTIFEHSVDGLAVVQGDRIRLANPAFARITGRSLDFLTGSTLDVQSDAIVHPDDVAEQRIRTRRYLDGVVDDGPNTFRVMRPDGSVRHVLSLRTDFPYHGEPARLVTFIDDTDRWQAEQAYRTIFEESIDGLLLVQNDVVVMANRAVGGILSRDSPLVGRQVGALVAEFAEGEDAEQMETRIARWLSHGQVPPRVTYRIRRPDGTNGLLFVQTSVVTHRGAPAALVAIVDLTDRWRAEEAYRAVFERSLEGLLVMSGTHVLMANRAAAELSGYAIDELTGLTRTDVLARLIHADDRPILDAALGAADNAATRHELRLQHRSGSLRRVIATCAPMSFAGRPALLFSLIDITERSQAEAALRDLNAALEARVAERTAALQATAQELEAFSYSASHDLRAPLRSIDGLCQAVMEDHAAVLPDDATGLLRRVRAAAANMATLIDQLMQLSRVVRGELRRQPVDLGAMAREVAADLARSDAGRQVSLTVADRLEASGDATLLRAVLANLLANAWKFTGPQPHARVTVGALPHDGRRAFFVRDNGVGFDPAQSERLFRPFQRLHPASEFGGHGIGLATVLRIVTRHGGRVWAESEVGQGATFYFTLE